MKKSELSKLITNEFAAHQGDVQMFSLSANPTNNGFIAKNFIAKSEKSGHAHALCGDYEQQVITLEIERGDSVVTEEGFIITVGKGGATMNHTKYENLTKEYWDNNTALPIADHQPTVLGKGIYYIGIQKRKKHFQKAWESVKD